MISLLLFLKLWLVEEDKIHFPKELLENDGLLLRGAHPPLVQRLPAAVLDNKQV